MRLWHKDLIPALPRQQLLGQWRECCLIAKNISEKGTPNHILVNKIMDYPIGHFWFYTNSVIFEMRERGYKVDVEKFLKWYRQIGEAFPPYVEDDELFAGWHNNRYLKQCYHNLQEKFDCGGMTREEYNKIYKVYYEGYYHCGLGD